MRKYVRNLIVQTRDPGSFEYLTHITKRILYNERC